MSETLTRDTESKTDFTNPPADKRRNRVSEILVRLAFVGALCAIYVWGIWQNPPGFYVDESALSYNGYLVSQTGAGESGVAFPLFFPVYTEPFTQYANPTPIYILAAVFKIFGPGIATARLTAAAFVFAACLLLGLLARRVSGSSVIGIISGGCALATPWLFEVGRVVLETFCYPLVVVLLLWSVFRASIREKWSLWNTAAVAASLTLVTYSYTIGRLLGPLLAVGLMVFVTSRVRLFSVLRVWAVYGLLLIPLAVYIHENPAVTSRFKTLSYIRPGASVTDVVTRFAARYAEDLSPQRLLFRGDVNPRHHLPGPHGSFYLGVFVLAVLGIVLVLARHRRSSWWWYVLFGLFASVVPGSLTNDPFHTLRMVAYPVFLLLLTVPALCWLLGRDERSAAAGRTASAVPVEYRHAILAALLTVTVVQAGLFFRLYYREGEDRGEYFDAAYKPIYDSAVAGPERPIYLVDGYWGPAYIHALWYATLEGRNTGEFVHLPYAERPPAGALVLSSEQECSRCEVIRSEGTYILYVVGPEPTDQNP